MLTWPLSLWHLTTLQAPVTWYNYLQLQCSYIIFLLGRNERVLFFSYLKLPGFLCLFLASEVPLAQGKWCFEAILHSSERLLCNWRPLQNPGPKWMPSPQSGTQFGYSFQDILFAMSWNQSTIKDQIVGTYGEPLAVHWQKSWKSWWKETTGHVLEAKIMNWVLQSQWQIISTRKLRGKS